MKVRSTVVSPIRATQTIDFRKKDKTAGQDDWFEIDFLRQKIHRDIEKSQIDRAIELPSDDSYCAVDSPRLKDQLKDMKMSATTQLAEKSANNP